MNSLGIVPRILITGEYIMENSAYSKYMRIALMLLLFIIPLLMVLIEELFGRYTQLNNIFAVLFIVFVATLYLNGILTPIIGKDKNRKLLRLVIFHYVKIPLFALCWILWMILVTIISISIRGLHDVQ